MEHLCLIMTKQRDFGWLAECKAPVLLGYEYVDICQSAHDAIVMTWNARTIKCSLTSASERLQMPKSHLSNILSGKKYMPDELRIPFMWLCGNLCMRQYEDKVLAQHNLNIELMEAERKVEEIKARRAA